MPRTVPFPRPILKRRRLLRNHRSRHFTPTTQGGTRTPSRFLPIRDEVDGLVGVSCRWTWGGRCSWSVVGFVWGVVPRGPSDSGHRVGTGRHVRSRSEWRPHPCAYGRDRGGFTATVVVLAPRTPCPEPVPGGHGPCLDPGEGGRGRQSGRRGGTSRGCTPLTPQGVREFPTSVPSFVPRHHPNPPLWDRRGEGARRPLRPRRVGRVGLVLRSR